MCNNITERGFDKLNFEQFSYYFVSFLYMAQVFTLEDEFTLKKKNPICLSVDICARQGQVNVRSKPPVLLVCQQF